MRCFILMAILFCSIQCKTLAANEPTVSAEKRKASSHRNYLIIHQHNCKFGFSVSRPKKSDANILLCIPAAFTGLRGGVCGLYSCSGAVAGSVARDLGGALQIQHGTCKIFDTKKGAELDAAFIENLKANKDSFFQQFQNIKDGHAETFKDKTSTPRRCIAELAKGEFSIIESHESVTFQQFNEDLLELGVVNALYTDVGPWSEGWYRDSSGSKLNTIGDNLMMTHKQSNWLVIEKTEAP